jgi:hypothetical protein
MSARTRSPCGERISGRPRIDQACVLTGGLVEPLRVAQRRVELALCISDGGLQHHAAAELQHIGEDPLPTGTGPRSPSPGCPWRLPRHDLGPTCAPCARASSGRTVGRLLGLQRLARGLARLVRHDENLNNERHMGGLPFRVAFFTICCATISPCDFLAVLPFMTAVTVL